MKRLIILTDEASEFLISKANFKYFTSMDINAISGYFISKGYAVEVLKFSEFDYHKEYKGVGILYQTSEAPGTFYKRYIEDLVYFLEKQGAVVLPGHMLLKAHHNKVFMEFLRGNFVDESLKSIRSWCYGSWVDALNYNSGFPVVIKQASSSGGAGVYLAKERQEYRSKVKKTGQIVLAGSLKKLIIDYIIKNVKKINVFFSASKVNLKEYDIVPQSTTVVVQNFIPGLNGDFKVLYFGGKYYMMYRKNRTNDFRASGSGSFHPVRDEEHEGILNFARRLTMEVDFPIIGMDIGFDGKEFHLLEFQVIHIGTSALHRSTFWHEYLDGKWIRYDGTSNLEEEYSRSVCSYLEQRIQTG